MCSFSGWVDVAAAAATMAGLIRVVGGKWTKLPQALAPIIDGCGEGVGASTARLTIALRHTTLSSTSVVRKRGPLAHQACSFGETDAAEGLNRATGDGIGGLDVDGGVKGSGDLRAGGAIAYAAGIWCAGGLLRRTRPGGDKAWLHLLMQSEVLNVFDFPPPPAN